MRQDTLLMTAMEHLSQWLQLTRTPAKVIRDIRRQLRKPLWPRAEASPVTGLPDILKQLLAPVDQPQLERTQAWLVEGPNRFFVTMSDPDYPTLLREVSGAPLVLFGEGRRVLLGQNWLAMVGSRRASPVAQDNTRWLATDLVRQGWGICSGLALGVDRQAHVAALAAQGDTLAILATGPDRAYPSRNRGLQQQIAERGLILTAYMPGTPPRTAQFPARNRIVSGMSLGTVVVAAGQHSGSLITARLAAEQGREVFALPGAARDPGMAGCHQLIQQGAQLVTGAQDIIGALPPLNPPLLTPCQEDQGEPAQLSLANDRMLANVGDETTALDEVVARSGLPVAQVMNQLIKLELEGLVQAVPGGYIKVRR